MANVVGNTCDVKFFTLLSIIEIGELHQVNTVEFVKSLNRIFSVL